MNALVGKVLTAVRVAKDREAILFDIEGGSSIEAVCQGDCCSYTWIEGVEVPALPALVIAVEDIEMPEAVPAGGEHRGGETDYVAFYGLKITLSTGHLVIDYRNDSNGYYGGSLIWGGEYGYRPSTVGWGEPC